MSRRVRLSEWIAIETLWELLEAIEELDIHGEEQRALEVGAAGGPALRGMQKAYVVPGDPLSSVAAMRHAWRAHYDFGRIVFDTSDNAVQFSLEGYPDIPMSQAMMTVGWGVAAGRAAGASNTNAEILDRPWRGAKCFGYRISF